ncbi:MAG: glycyl-radical enzyme activating protein [Candidatus Thorarchaeota archaeon]|nr:glycyl-radical enzyme activating protein [Candidatus Thorarchaeota archaeon]
MNVSGIVTNIQRCSTEDGPGIRTTVFFKGCPMKCLWCHNIETIDPDPIVVWYAVKCIGDQACVRACPESALELTEDGMKIDRELCQVCGACEEACPTGAMKIMGKIWSSDDLVEELLRDKVFFTTSNGGVTLSGGEATYQADFVVAVATGLQANEVHVALDTCGYCSEKVLRDILPHVDMVLYDLKVMDPIRHQEYTGVPIDRVLSNARIVARSGKPTWIRTPIIPGHTDDDENIRSIAQFIVENMPDVERYDLLAFNRMCTEKYTLFNLVYPLKDADLIPETTMERLAGIARDQGVRHVAWSGMTKDSRIHYPSNEQEEKPCAQ